MLLAIDVGNTNIVLGVFEGAVLTESWRLATLHDRTADEIRVFVSRLFEERQIAMTRVRGVIIASVVPPLTGPMREMAKRCFGREALDVEAGTNTGMPILYENPDEVGADRVVNGVAGFELYGRQHGQPVIVVDFGTATTFDAITAEGEYLGGVICPGVEISANALFQRAARLPRVDVRKPPHLIGRTTVGSIQSGLFYGYVAMVEGIVERMQRALAPGPNRGAVCVATGGMAQVIASETPVIQQVNPDLTLQGLRLVWERNVGN